MVLFYVSLLRNKAVRNQMCMCGCGFDQLNLTLGIGFNPAGDQRMKTRSSASAQHRREAQLQIVDSASFRGKISTGSSSMGNVDKYFIEPSRQFRTLESARRYLNRARAILENKTRAYEGSRTKQDHRSLEYASKGFRLPKGWTVDEVPRKNSYQIDKYYVERRTGKRFRSLVSVERYLQAVGNSTVDSGYMMRSERLLLTMNRNDIRFQNQVIDSNPPKKVKWILTGPGGDMFTANVSGLDVSNSVKQKWSEAFVTLIQDRFQPKSES